MPTQAPPSTPVSHPKHQTNIYPESPLKRPEALPGGREGDSSGGGGSCGNNPTVAPSSSLVRRKFSVENPHSDTPEQEYRFSGNPTTRRCLLKHLPHLDLTQKQIERFITCGSDAWIQREQGSGRLRVSAKTCKLRFCPACRSRLARTTRKGIERILATAPVSEWRFVTLTMRHSRTPLLDQLRHLKNSFRRLRQRKAWKDHVIGGVAVIEINRNQKTNQWHPHIHLVIRGTYFPQPKLSKAWLSASRSSAIVDIRSVWTTEGAVDYIAKYITKSPLTAFIDDPKAMIEYVKATARGHMVIPFGTAKLPPEKDKPDPPSERWEPVCSLTIALQRASMRVDYYVSLINQLDKSSEPDTPTIDQPNRPPGQPQSC